MKLGVDFDGTIIRYAVCAKSDGGDVHIIITTETLDEAKHELQIRVNREKKKNHMIDTKFWIMKQTYKYEKVYEVDVENRKYIRFL